VNAQKAPSQCRKLVEDQWLKHNLAELAGSGIFARVCGWQGIGSGIRHTATDLRI
jgi:hypothetical protein